MFDFSIRCDPETSLHGFRWTPQSQRRFLDVLAKCGSVVRACHAVSKSRQSAHVLRRKSKGQPFAVGWDGALISARRFIEGEMLQYAFTPVAAQGHRHPLSGRLMWRVCDPMLGAGLGMAHLCRLDKAVAEIGGDAGRYGAATAALEDWEGFLDAIAGLQPEICQLASNTAVSHLQATDDQAMSTSEQSGM